MAGTSKTWAFNEMVLRRCHFIVVSDAGQDPECSFADLGEAVRKIRIDFGIPIEFGPMTIYPRDAIDTLRKPWPQLRSGSHSLFGSGCSYCDGDFRYFIADILKRHLKMQPPDWLSELRDETKNKVV